MPKRTPLYAEHVKLGAKIIDFAGWEMPVQYTSVIEEHVAVRTRAGLFDVSHMGEVEIRGRGALAFVQHLTTNDVTKIPTHHAQYSVLCNERGTVIDDIIVYRFNDEHFLIVVNASNREKDVSWIRSHKTRDVTIEDVSDNFALIALQGPLAPNILKAVSTVPVDDIPSFHFCEATIGGKAGCLASRTGYTGELGFEVFCPPEIAPAVWNALFEEGEKIGLLAAGLGARDTLRLEMCYSLYGHEITEETNPLEAGLGWVVKLDTRDDFIGKQALLAAKAQGLKRKLVGFKMQERGIPRSNYPLVARGEKVGFVTSGTMSPSLGYAIGLGYVPTALSALGSEFSVDIRGELRKAMTVKMPFYKRSKE